MQCALVYNLYRGVGSTLEDLNLDALADDYGSCQIFDIVGTDVRDADDPQPGLMHWYLVTGENFVGESPLGDNSRGDPRQATTVCP